MNEFTPTAERHLSGRDAAARGDEETLVADARGLLSPSQQVEQRLIGLLNTSPVLVSQVQRRLKPGPR